MRIVEEIKSERFNRRIEAGKVTQIDIERTTLARRNEEIVLAYPTENGRWLLHARNPSLMRRWMRLSKNLQHCERRGSYEKNYHVRSE